MEVGDEVMACDGNHDRWRSWQLMEVGDEVTAGDGGHDR